MNLQQFRHFLSISRRLHFGQAAAELHMTQPPLSKSMQRLEQALGAQLLERTTRRVSLTKAGVALVPVAERIVERLEAARAKVAQAANLSSPLVVVGYAEDALAGALARLLQEIADQAPAAQIRFVEQDDASAADMLLSDQIHLALSYARPSRRSGLRALVLSDGRLAAALQAGDPLAAAPIVTLEALAEQPLILFPKEHGPTTHQKMESVLAHLDPGASVIGQLASSRTRLRLAAAGLGRTFVSSTFVEAERGDLVFRTVEGFETDAFRLHLVWNPRSRNSLVQRLTRRLARAFPAA